MIAATSSIVVLPGEWLGIVGGGQLGRMFCHAAQSMGYKVAVLDPASSCPAGVVADRYIQANYDDSAALRSLSESCRAITTEFENVPAESLQLLAERSQVSPSGQAVAIVQDRIREKSFIAQSGVPVAPYVAVTTVRDIEQAPQNLFPGILKVARLGYDGKGQARVSSRLEAIEALRSFDGLPCVLEALVPLAFEISVVIARGFNDECVAYTPATNVHHEGILAVSSVDRQVDPDSARLHQRATDAALAIAAKLDYHGVMCVEFFVLANGDLIANEIAPRPHNSGHYTMNACVTSQFEQQVRAMAGLPLGNSDCLSPSVMLNILGDVWFDPVSGQRTDPDWAAVLAVPGAKLHLYGKAEARHGRKMGHVNILGATLSQAQADAARVASVLGIES